MAEDAVAVTKLPVRTSLLSSDQFVCVSNAAGSNGGNVSLITVGNLFGNSQAVPVQQADPANSIALTITQGSLFFSNNFGYIAVSPNVTKRFAISSF